MSKNNIKLFNTFGLFSMFGAILLAAIDDSNQIVLITSTVILILIIASLLIYLFVTKPKDSKTDNLGNQNANGTIENKVIVFKLEESGEVVESTLDLEEKENNKTAEETTEIQLND